MEGHQEVAKSPGEISGDNPSILKTRLRRQGIVVNSFKKKPQPLFGGDRKITNADIALFTRQMATMLKAGVPLVQGLAMVAEGLSHPSLQKLIKSLKRKLLRVRPLLIHLRSSPNTLTIYIAT